ncbi:hypothetical protein [Gracilibacillus alcaliphilus]|uniref:hypothetical protein n=1 Tax=Gracilibacillus alcaliphilus TaxID=1401441 RepID=UPI00195B78D1|nr:hypothetical protein [Gracilibacillus alcaliphilus]MBM7678525.1 hypothetical protein [Gracilibacillus alcaliphilus]
MKRIITLIIASAISIGVLSACTMDNDNEMDDQPDDINYTPERNNNGRPDIDTDPRDVREPNEYDTPFNMDEEEPDLDEEPSEERRGY